jgi:hypothetical protein
MEGWADLTPEARSLVGTLWAEKTGVDLVITTLDPVQSKEKILSVISNMLEQKDDTPWVGLKQRQDDSVNQAIVTAHHVANEAKQHKMPLRGSLRPSWFLV